MPDNQSSNTSLKFQLSLASLMFFAPLVKHLLRQDDAFDIDESEKRFIKGYMILGSLNLGLTGISLLFGILSIFFDYQWLYILFLLFSIALLIILIGGTIAVFSDIQLKIDKEGNNLTDSISTDFVGKKNILVHYIPIMNTYMRYSLHNFDGDLYILKESQLLRTLFAAICISQNLRLIGILLIIIILRIISLIIIGDILPKRWKSGINYLFNKNIEEIWGIILGSIVRSIGTLFGHKDDISLSYKKYSLPYSYLFNIGKHNTILRQFAILVIGTGYMISTIEVRTRFGFVIVGLFLLWMRYIVMIINWKHLPPLPLIDDIFTVISGIFLKKDLTTKK